MSSEKENSKSNTSDAVKNTDVYKALEAMVSIQVTELSELIGKQQAAKSKTSQNLYAKKIEKKREKILKYLFQLDKLTNGRVEEVLDELEKEVERDNDTEDTGEEEEEC